MTTSDTLDAVLTFGPKTFTIPRVIRDVPDPRRAFSILIGNPSSRPARPVFVPNVPYITVGPSSRVEVFLGGSWGGRSEYRATDEIEPRGVRGGGRRAFDVFVDSQHHAFPVGVCRDVPVILDVYEEVEGRYLPIGSIAVEIAEISDVDPVYAGTVAIDFGTTNTCIVCSPGDAWNPDLVTLDGQSETALPGVRSIVAYENVHNRNTPRFVVGSRASAQLGQGDRTSVIHSFKRHIGSPREWLVGVDAERKIVKYGSRAVAGHFLAEVKQRVEAELNARIPELSCTFPAAFSQARMRALGDLFEDVGHSGRRRGGQAATPHRMVVDEATAAAVFYIRKAFDRLEDVRQRVSGNAFTVLCYDLGGGTTDMSLTRFSIHGGEKEAGDAAAPEGMYVDGEVVTTDGIAEFGGDNMTLMVFRLLKAVYAQRFAELLEERYREGHEDGVVLGGRVMRPGEIVRAMKNLKGEVLEWIQTGDDLDADASIGFEGHAGAPLTDAAWTTIDRLVPTRTVGFEDHGPEEGEYRAFLFNELWVEAENIKQAFGTPDEEGGFPLVVRSRPPQPLQEAYNTGGGMSVEIGYDTVCTHFRPRLAKTLAQTDAMVRETGREAVDFFVLAGNACRFPLVRDLFAEHMQPLGAVGSIDGREGNVYFDAADAKAAVAHGACMIAFEREVAGLSTWRIQEPENVLPYALGRPKPVVSFQDRNKVMHVWFEAGEPLPARCEVTVAGRNPTLRIVGMRRAGAMPRQIGHFDFSREESRCAAEDLPADVVDAIAACDMTSFADDEGEDHYTIDIVVTADRCVWAQRAGDWYALCPASFELAPEANPFSGTH